MQNSVLFVHDLLHEICSHIPEDDAHTFFHLMWTCKRLFKWVRAYPFKVKWRCALSRTLNCVGIYIYDICFTLPHTVRRPSGTFIAIPESNEKWNGFDPLRYLYLGTQWEVKIKHGILQDISPETIADGPYTIVCCPIRPDTPHSLWDSYYHGGITWQ